MNTEGIIYNKQHLNLSYYAIDIIEMDRLNEPDGNPNGFLNKVFAAYRDRANASVYNELLNSREHITNLLTKAKISNPAEKERFIKAYLTEREDALRAEINSYQKGVQLDIYLSKDNVSYLEDNFFDREDTFYDKRPMKYVKAVIEEYTRKSPLEREKILYADRIRELEQYIDTGKLLIIKTSHHRYEVRPYKLMTDKAQSYHYLVGFTRPFGQVDEKENIGSFRVSRMGEYKARAKSYRSGRICDYEKVMIEDAIQEKGIEFLASDLIDVKVRLTEQGMKIFHSTSRLRPAMKSYTPDGDGFLCNFHCTENQLRSYFFRFGADAEVVSPAYLRDHFKTQFRKALSVYGESPES